MTNISIQGHHLRKDLRLKAYTNIRQIKDIKFNQTKKKNTHKKNKQQKNNIGEPTYRGRT